MDLSSLAVSATSTLELKHPVSGESLGCSIELCGKDSDIYRNQYAALVKSVADTQAKGGEADFTKLDIDVYVACTVSWSGIEIGEETLECTPENVRRVYSDQAFKWLHEQVVAFVGNRENFMQRT